MRKQHRVTLTADERARLQGLLAAGTGAARTLTRARILLKADQGPEGPGWTDRQITTALDTSRPTVERVRKQFAQEGLAATLTRRRPATTPGPMLDGRQEAQLVALTCSAPPPGRARWSLRLLADKFVELAEAGVETISRETVRRVFKQTRSSRGRSGSGASRPSRAPNSSGGWRTCSTSTPAPTILARPRSAWMRPAPNSSTM